MLQMDLKSKFEAITACSIIKINSLTLKRPYEIDSIERTTKFGPSLILTLITSFTSTAKVFLPKRYCGLFGDDDVEAIQNKSVRLQLIYLGSCPVTKKFDMAIELLGRHIVTGTGR
jgi:hypothetical protein